MKINLSRTHYPVTVLGHGTRIGIWLQGCSIGCKGCVSQDTWSIDEGNHVAIDTLLEWCKDTAVNGLDGITITGGEPFEQPEALSYLLMELRRWTDALPESVDYLCYTGLKQRVVEEEYPEILHHLDTIITEPYSYKLPTASLRGSSNQKLLMLTDLGKERYGRLGPTLEKNFQFAVDEDHIWFIGIPERGDMSRIEHNCRARGLTFQHASWRT